MLASISSPSIVCRRMRSRLTVVERARPVEDVGIDRELADVVQHGDELDLGRVERVESPIRSATTRARGARRWLCSAVGA